ncbi:DUF4192 domain-containing protein [Actinokineospora iranica]|uniref:DUF4192 domain-containing protein n=1 Tax=Actinokineospora iranica TaxID=1271860 RepID=A0A1G6VQV6_9PSEU|nr:DUF4192 domain-containing protein [Actinokineospora iranica]SDD55939.1 protein of unknown function [Actinokineospora iranica]
MTADAITLSISTPEGLIAAVPNVLGFHPHESIVVITVTAEHSLGVTLRIPLDTDPDTILDALNSVTETGIATAMVVVVGPGAAADHEPAYRTVRSALEGNGVVVAAGLWAQATTGNQRWSSYDNPALHGTTSDSSATLLSAELAMRGLRVHDSIHELAALLAPEPADVLRARGHQAAALAEDGHTGDVNDLVRLVEQTAADPAAPLTMDLPRLALALTARDAPNVCATLVVEGHGRAVEHVMTLLARGLPDRFRACAAALAALAAYDNGNGAFARLCVEAALEADPAHMLAQLMNAVIASSFPPHELRKLLHEAVAA